MSMMPSHGGVKHSPDLTARLKSRKVLPAEAILLRKPSLFGKMQGKRQASTELTYLDMMRTASHGDDHSFGDLIARLNSTGDLPVETPRFSATPSTPNTPSCFMKSPRSTDPSTMPITPHTPSLFERAVYRISRGSSVECSLASTTPSPPKTLSQFERNNSCRSTASTRLASLFQRSSLHLPEPNDKPRQKASRTVSWDTHIEIWRPPSRSVTWSTHIEVFSIPARERAADDWQPYFRSTAR